jgi:hypothetical protein
MSAPQSAGWSGEEAIAAFEREHAAALTHAHRAAIRYCRAANAAQKYLTVTVRPVTDDEPRPSPEEQADVLRRALALGYRDVAATEGGRAGAPTLPAEPAG